MYKTIMAFGIFIFMVSTVWALEITSPKEDQVFYAGDEFSVIVKPDSGEDWLGVMYGLDEMDYSFLRKEYSVRVKIPADKLGYQHLSVGAVSKSGHEIELKRRIFVKLPPNVVLQSIEVNPNPLFLEKLPTDSPPDDLRIFGTRDLKVLGVYSDGVKRKLTTSASGTAYTSSNEKVVIVDSGGKAIAQGIGKATITVRNGRIVTSVRVVVDPYKE